MSEEINRDELPDGYFIPGVARPDPVEGRKWFKVQNPSTGKTAGYKLGSRATEQGDFALPTEAEQHRGGLISQSDFLHGEDGGND